MHPIILIAGHLWGWGTVITSSQLCDSITCGSGGPWALGVVVEVAVLSPGGHSSPMRSSRSMATVSKALRIMGYSSSTSLKLSTDRE